MGAPRPTFFLIKQSPDRAEVERAAEEYQRQHPGHKVVIDTWKDLLLHNSANPGVWRARVWKTEEERSLIGKLIDSIRR